MAITKGKIITITSVKGGVGKTTFLLGLANVYKNMNKKVLIIDNDLYSGDIEAILNVESKKDVYVLFEDITNNNFYEIGDYITHYDDNIDFISAPTDPRYAGKVRGNYLNLLFNRVSSIYDVVLIDTSHVLNEVNLVTMDHSSEIVYLINNNSMNLKNMRSMISIFSDMHLENYKIVLYEARDKGKTIFNKFDIKSLIKDNIDYVISSDYFNKDIDKYIVDGKIFDMLNKQKGKSMKTLNTIAEDLIK